MAFRIAELPAHEHLLDDVHALAERLNREQPDNTEPLIQRWTGTREQFAKV